MGTGRDRVPEWLLERLHAGELPADEAAKVRARLEKEPGGLERLAALAEDDAATLEELPPSLVAGEVLRRKASLDRIEAAKSGAKPRGLFFFAPLLVAAGALAVVLARPGSVSIDPAATIESPEEIRLKGECSGPCLLVFRQVDAQRVEKLRDGAEARAADHLQLKYQSFGKPFGVVISIDGRGSVTLHHPITVGDSQALTKTGTAVLPRAYTLDDAPDFERFIFLTGDRPFDVDRVLAAADELARNPRVARREKLRVEGAQSSITLQKVSP